MFRADRRSLLGHFPRLAVHRLDVVHGNDGGGEEDNFSDGEVFSMA